MGTFQRDQVAGQSCNDKQERTDGKYGDEQQIGSGYIEGEPERHCTGQKKTQGKHKGAGHLYENGQVEAVTFPVTIISDFVVQLQREEKCDQEQEGRKDIETCCDTDSAQHDAQYRTGNEQPQEQSGMKAFSAAAKQQIQKGNGQEKQNPFKNRKIRLIGKKISQLHGAEDPDAEVQAQQCGDDL